MTREQAMDTTHREQGVEALVEALRTVPPADWLIAMHEHYRKTGTFRPEDLRRLLGDPTRRVEVGPQATLASFFRTQ
jgi:hypothetical protein